MRKVTLEGRRAPDASYRCNLVIADYPADEFPHSVCAAYHCFTAKVARYFPSVEENGGLRMRFPLTSHESVGVQEDYNAPPMLEENMNEVVKDVWMRN